MTFVLVTARSGSKSVPNKNIMQFGSETALSLRIKAVNIALPSATVVVSTDSEEYAKIARDCGAETPFIRPDFLARDESSSVDVIMHALEFIGNTGKQFDHLIVVEPSSPFCRPQDISEGFEMLKKYNCPVVSVKEVSPNPIFISEMGPNGEFGELGARIKKIDSRRQAFAPNYTPNGCFYGVPILTFKKHQTFYLETTKAFVMPQEYSLEIDEPQDALYADFLWREHVIDHKFWKL